MPKHVEQLPIARVDRGKVRAAYAREDLLEARQEVMDFASAVGDAGNRERAGLADACSLRIQVMLKTHMSTEVPDDYKSRTARAVRLQCRRSRGRARPGKPTIYRSAQQKKLPTVKIGGRRLFPKAAIDEMIRTSTIWDR